MKAYFCSFDELPEWVNKEYGLSNNGAGKEYARYLIIEDVGYRRCYSDAMEPEDASFGRNLYWIVTEIMRGRA